MSRKGKRWKSYGTNSSGAGQQPRDSAGDGGGAGGLCGPYALHHRRDDVLRGGIPDGGAVFPVAGGGGGAQPAAQAAAIRFQGEGLKGETLPHQLDQLVMNS